MTCPRNHQALAALVCAAAISGCGGGTGSPPLPSGIAVPPASPAAPSLIVSPSSQALAVSGQPRHFLITNVGGQDALNLLVTAGTALPTGSGFTTDCAATLAPGASCTLTVTPGADPSAIPGDTAPQPAELRIAGSNTNTLALPFQVLDFGSVYQGGYVFDIDDGTPASGGVGGKVAALGDAQSSLPWSLRDADRLLGTSNTDGAANTAAIVSHFGPPDAGSSGMYPAWACATSAQGGYDDWYLPAICEMGYDGDMRGSGCGTQQAPTLANIHSNLLRHGIAGEQFYTAWSSTDAPDNRAWYQTWWTGLSLEDSQRSAPQSTGGNYFTRCVRALTP